MGDQPKYVQDFQSSALLSAAKVGALSGTAGLIYGGAAGVIRSPNPMIHSLSCGIHWFACGSAFWWLRSNIIKHHYQDKASLKERIYTSALCGGIAGGSVTKLMGGRLVPGAIIFSILGYCGQSVFNRVDAWQLENAHKTSKPLMQRMAESKWIPLRSLSDQEYRDMLSEKLLSIDAEIALLDDKIEELEKSRPVPASSLN
ncbi:NADH-cytochrome B5 reductase [Penicillium digitatum]|uniref:NADH-cytochrome B5 reductase n=1 Tax=Penicillium digitatum TaxID=36651 RepID=A0A7T7BK29_PENDI|nr:NADH-cytochrome B5 reductase [Penicillium digitatum]